MPTLIPALANVNLPPHLHVEVTNSFDGLMNSIGRYLINLSGKAFFGCASRQGLRLHFATAMSIDDMLVVSKFDRSAKGDSIAEVTEHANRPAEVAHARHLRTYLLETAASNEKFILPSFVFNYGVGLHENSPDAILIIFVSGKEDALTWPAMLILPSGAKLDTTDGAHRRSQIDSIILDRKISAEDKEALRNNACDVVVVFDASRADSHQDFADCGKAKPIPTSMVVTFDIRDWRNNATRQLVAAAPFLSAYVDATARNVNLSGGSRKVWSMSAVRMFVSHVVDHVEGDDNNAKLKDAAEFFNALAAHLPQLRALDDTRRGVGATTTGALRDVLGGDVALRGVGMAVFARAFIFAREHGLSFDAVARALARIDWNVLRCERADLQNEDDFAAAVTANANPLWHSLLIVGSNRYRISSESFAGRRLLG